MIYLTLVNSVTELQIERDGITYVFCSMAPKSDVERQRERRKRLKENKEQYLKHLQDDRERKKEARKLLTKGQLKRLQTRQKEATRKCRQNQKNFQELLIVDNQDSGSPYKSTQSLGKAKARTLRALPKSPRKKRRVLEELADEVLGTNLRSGASQRTQGLTDEVKEAVTQFYHRESYTMPGKADVVTVKTELGKEKRQKKLLMMTVNEMYENFKMEYPEILIGRSKFAELRPVEVLLSSATPRNVCGCIYHSNIILLLEALHENTEVPLYTRNGYIELAICNPVTEKCYQNECDNCKDGKKMLTSCYDLVPEEDRNKEINWYTWSNKAEGFLTKERRRTKIRNIIDELVAKTPQFVWHIFIKDRQSSAYVNDKNEAQNDQGHTALLQMDFAENYAVKYQVNSTNLTIFICCNCRNIFT
jgi:hypothetical protein